MEKPSKRNLFDDDSEDDDYKPGQSSSQPDAGDETSKPQADEMEEVKIDTTTPATQE
jgi:hypothetical protein